MRAPAIPADDRARSAAVGRLALLDTPSEERFDRITRTVARLLDAPIAVLNLVDDHRQWAKSAVGMSQGTEFEHRVSFCAHVVADAGPVLVSDTARDERFRDNPMALQEPGLRCYFGVPVKGPDGHIVGSLCIAGHEPRELSDDEFAVLSDLVGWVEAELEHDRLIALTEEERQLRERLQAITSSVGDAVVVFDAAGTITDVNAAATALTGYESAELIGNDLGRSLPEDSRQRLEHLLTRGALDKPVSEELELARRDGDTVPIEVTVSSTLDGDTYIVVARDVSQRRRHQRTLEKLRRRYEVILDAAAEAIIGITSDGFVDYANPAAGRLLGTDPEGLLGQNLHERHHHHHADGTPYHWHECPTARTVTEGVAHDVLDEIYSRSDGSKVEVEYSSTPLFDDERVTGAVLVLRDIGARREGDRLKSQFVSTVSHELRTPLTSLRGALSLVRGGVVGDIPAEALELLDTAQSSTDRLIRLVNDLLDLSRLDAGVIELHPTATSLATVVATAVAGVRTAAGEIGVEIDVEVADVSVHADADRLVQALTNLLGNAVRFSPPGGTVTVSSEQDAGCVTIEVRDMGPGVPDDARARIFERFGQADSSDARSRTGTGLGLPIARELVERHGGRLWVGDAPVGSVFNLELPLSAAPEDAWSSDEVEEVGR